MSEAPAAIDPVQVTAAEVQATRKVLADISGLLRRGLFAGADCEMVRIGINFCEHSVSAIDATQPKPKPTLVKRKKGKA